MRCSGEMRYVFVGASEANILIVSRSSILWCATTRTTTKFGCLSVRRISSQHSRPMKSSFSKAEVYQMCRLGMLSEDSSASRMRYTD